MAFSPIKASDGYYVALFPMDYMRLTQTWGAGTLSHRNHQTDWAGRTAQYPYYAWAPMRCYGTTSSGFTWTTTEPVHTPSGLKYVSIWVAHDNDASRGYVGKTIQAGELLGRTGTRGYATGDHLHLDVAFGQNVSAAGDHLTGDVNPTEAFYINTSYTIANLTANGITLNFQTWNETPTEPVYTITVNGGSASSYSGHAGDTVTITAIIPDGYDFGGWSVTGGSVANAGATSTIYTFGSSNATITANFIAVYHLTVGGGTANKYSGHAGDTITITATPGRLEVFTHWSISSGNGSIGNQYSENTTFTFGNSNAIIIANTRPLNVMSGDGWIPYQFIKHRNKY